jgi:hypothetical protein
VLRIDESDLLLAIGDHDISYFLDLQNGVVIPLLEDVPEIAPVLEAIDTDPQHYTGIEPVPSPQAFRWMEQFAQLQEDGHIRAQLRAALEGRRPFRAFKDVLADHPGVRSTWDAFEQERQLGYARAWLKEEGIDAEIVRASAGASPPTLLRPNNGLQGTDPRA